MKKLFLSIIIIVLLVAIVIFAVKTINEKKINYENVQVQKYNYFRYYENEKYGIIDKEGNIIIKAEYDDIIIPNPEKDIFSCYKNNENSILNSQNEKLFEQYDKVQTIKLKNNISVLSYEKNILKYEKDGKWGLIDFTGKQISKNIYDSIENLQASEGKFLVKKDEKYGVINANGKVIINNKYDSITSDEYYSEETGYVNAGFITGTRTEEGYRYGYVNFEGKKILNEEYNDLVRIQDQEKVYLIVSKDGRYGLYENSKKIINTEYQFIEYCDTGVLILRKNKNYGIANLHGKIIVDIKYSKIEPKGIYLYAENSNEKKVYNSEGKTININYDKIVYKTDSKDYNVFSLMNNGITKYGIEDSNGKELVKPTYEYIEYAYSKYFIAKDDKGNTGLINSNGKVLLDFKYDVIQKIKNKNMIQTIESNTRKTEIYSYDLKLICSLEKASINSKDGYIMIYNDKETIYLNDDGKILKSDSEELKNMKYKSLPEIIGEYKKNQRAIDNIYYEKINEKK